ncbi:MAG: response regulator [Ideonella sp.]|nr:response regulator [Ideonella sp.]
MSLRVLLVEDDRELRTTLRDALTIEGYEVLTAASLSEGLALLAHATRPPMSALESSSDAPAVDLVILDLGLPDGDGETLLATLRRRHALPVLVVSARHGDGQKIRLLDAGADDYLVKPFSVGELLARMRVALRHRGTRIDPAVTHYVSGGLDIDLAAHRVTLNGAPCHLTPTEFKLLARLVRSAGQVVTHRQLLVDVWGAEYCDHTHYLRLYMGQLRAKLEADPAEPQRLLTEPGVGYRLIDADE